MVSVDEMIATFKGQHSLKTYNPGKPRKRGYNLWCLAGAKLGYVHQFQIFGDNTIDHENVESL